MNSRFPYLRRLFAATLLLAAVAWSGLSSDAAQAAASDWDRTEQTAVRLISAAETAGGAAALRLGLQFELKDGWKIYWRSPGDAGFPPQPVWSGSENVKTARLSWPIPQRFSVVGLETLGYKHEVVLPVDLTPAEAGKPVTVRATVPYLTCDDICIPYTAKLSLTLPAGPPAAAPEAHLIDRYAARVPGDGARQGLAVAKVAGIAAQTRDGKVEHLLRLTATSSSGPFGKPDLFLEGPETLTFSAPEVTLQNDGTSARFAVRVFGAKHLEGGAASLPGRMITATLVDGPRSAEAKVKLALISLTEGGAKSAPASAAAATDARTIVVILLLALLGGLILNLMPCVLPVLSIKVLSAIGHGGRETPEVRRSFIASALGILFAFLVLATGLVVLKQAGASIGWGIQFQQPWFLALMAVIVTLFACNLWGFFEVHTPEAINELGEAVVHRKGIAGHFLQGALATLLATPCSAPFLGTAVGFALSRGAIEIYAIFSSLALGLALPYLTIAVFPALATSLPRPGAWMVRLRRILGFALALAAVWLVWVLAGVLGTPAALLAGGGLIVLGIVLYLGRGRSLAVARVAPTAIAAAIVLAAALAPLPEATGATDRNPELKALWRPFDEAEIRRLVADGKTVLVDVTADWCVTCQVNKKLVLDRGPVAEALKSGRVIGMLADWTRPDPTISAYLARFGRYGIPFNAVYGPNAPNGIALPELLTDGLVTEAITQAAPKATVAGR